MDVENTPSEQSYTTSSTEPFRDSHDEIVYSPSSHEGGDPLAHLLSAEGDSRSRPTRSIVARLTAFLSLRSRTSPLKRYSRRIRRRFARSSRPLTRRLALFLYAFITTILTIIVVGGSFFPSYTHRPPHYEQLRQQARHSDLPGRANLDGQKVFIAASVFDREGKLARGAWAESLLTLVRLLGPDNVFVSIYENDSGEEGQVALKDLGKRLGCNHVLTSDTHLAPSSVSNIELPDGTRRSDRIAYLAEVRNRALAPLENSDTIYDKLLFLNDVVFDPVEAAQLLFATNVDEKGQANYRAACAVDFINPFKFYDTVATRDLEGYSMGLPFFPWFSADGGEGSLEDVLGQKDAVRVRSCWGGMVAFDARFFQKGVAAQTFPATAASDSPSNTSAPYRFRAEPELYWYASECCLIQADIQSNDPHNPGIYMNPFVRVAYDSRTLSWLKFTRRFERLYTPVHFILDLMLGLPKHNPRREEVPWQDVLETTWVADQHLPGGGSFQTVSRLAGHSGFCGARKLSVIKETVVPGSRNWEFLPVPPLRRT